MLDPKITFGRLGNQLFQYFTLYAKAKEENRDFFFQDYRYFDKYKEELKSVFNEGVGFLPEVGIHFRQASNPINPEEPKYSENSFYVNLAKTDYYFKAIAEFPYQTTFLVVSDDIESAKQFFTKEKWPDKEFLFSEGNDEITDFNLFCSCKGQIIANSSFSYMSAYLSPNRGKVIAPLEWYSDGINSRTILPPEWLRV